MKTKLIRFISIFVAVVMLFTIVPLGSITASAATYSASSAVSFANSHWNDGVGLCAEFVSRCLAAGGISIPNSAYYSTSQQSYQNNSGTLDSYRNPYTCSAALLLYLSQNYPIITNPSYSQISVGDVVFMYGGSSGQWKDGHVGIVISTSGGVPVYAAHNKATNTGNFSSSYPCTYVAKMNGIITTHKVNSSYGTNFTAYPKSKITAENIFDENHNMVSSTAWIGTTDKCTIYEVYTDGCCKLSYPIDSGGSKTVYSKISLFNTHTHSYTGARLQEPDHPHVITQRCVDYATCGGYIVTGEYGQSKTCQQCWYASFDFSASSVSLKVGESKTISATINGYWPDTMVGVFDYDTSRIAITTGQNTITFKGLKTGTCTLKLIIYSDSSKTYIIGSKSVTVIVSDPTYTGRVSFDKSSISLVMPDNKTSTLNIELTGTWPEGAGYTFDYNSNVVSMSQNGTVLTITAKNAGSTNFTINIVNKNNNNALITSAVCPITVKNATYTIKYNANGGNGAPSTQIKTYGTPIRISDVVPKREGFIFKGWTIWASSTTVKYLPGDEITANMDDGATLTLYAVWEEITLKSIKANSPDKVLYYMGEYLDTSGLRLRLEYSDGSTSVIDNGYSVSGFDSSVEGRKNVTVSYGGKTDSFEVMVIPSSVSLSQKNTTLHLGDTKTVYATTDPGGYSVEWSVWNNKIVNVLNGKITAVGVGKTTISVTFEWQGYYSFATCEVTVENHKYDNACDTSCNVCKTVRTVTHNYSAATCTSPKICKVCKATSGKALGHTYSSNCDKSCNVCGATRTVGTHKYSNSCDTTCNYCNAKRTIKHTYSNSCDTTCNVCKAKRTIKHTYSNNCDTSCNVCKATRTITHAYKTTTTKATLTKNGSIVKKCTVCGKVASNTAIKYAKSFKLSTTSYTYDGKVKTPSVTVKDSAGKTLKKNTDYTVTYASGRKNVGTYKVTVKMIGKYSGTKTLTIKINPAKLSSYKLSTTAYTYDGKVKTPSVTVKNASGTKLTKNTHYTVTYASGRKNVGTYKVTIKGKGNYTGTKTLTFKIIPAKTTVSKLAAGKKSITVAITKKSTQVTGYQIQYSTSKTFSKATTKTISSCKTTKYTLKSLSAKKTYYVRVRTYKKVGSTTYYSGWSMYKYVKTK